MKINIAIVFAVLQLEKLSMVSGIFIFDFDRKMMPNYSSTLILVKWRWASMGLPGAGLMGRNGKIRGLIEPNSPRNSSPFFAIMILNVGILVNY